MEDFAWTVLVLAALAMGIWWLASRWPFRTETVVETVTETVDSVETAAEIVPMVSPPDSSQAPSPPDSGPPTSPSDPESSPSPAAPGTIPSQATPTRPGRRPAPSRPTTIAGFERRVAARLDADPVDPTPLEGPVRFLVEDVAWDDPAGRPLVRFDEARGVFDVDELLEGRFVAADVVVERPDVRIERGAGQAGWNYEAALAGLLGGPDAEPADTARSVLIDRLRIEGGRLVFAPPGSEYELRGVEAVVTRLAMGGAGPTEVAIASVRAVAELSDPDAVRDVTLDDARLSFPDGALDFAFARLRVGGSVARDASGRWDLDAAGLGLTAELRIDPLLAEEVRIFFPELPDGEARLALRVEPRDGGRTALLIRDAAAEAAEARVLGAIDLVVGGGIGPELLAIDLVFDPLTLALVEGVTGPLPYAGKIRGRVQGRAAALEFDATATLTAPEVPDPFTVEISGSAALAEGGLALGRLDLDVRRLPLVALRPIVPGIPLTGVVTGRATLRGPPDEAPITLDVLLEVEQGALTLAGTVDLRGEVPAYDLSGRLIGIDLDALLEPEVPPVTIDANYAVAGSGTSPEQIVASVRIDGRFSGWVTSPTDSLRLRMRADRGILSISTLTARVGPIALEAEGSWRFLAPSAGEIAYDLVVDDFRPLAPYLPIPSGARMAGAVRTTGRLAGPLEGPRVIGELEGEGLRYAAWAAHELEARYDVDFADGVETALVEATARDLISPDGSVWRAARAELDFRRPVFTITARAARVDEGRFILASRGRVEDDVIHALLESFRLELEGQSWALVRPAEIIVDPEGVLVRQLRIERLDGEGLLAIDGRLPPDLPSELRLEAEALPIDDILALVGVEPVVGGQLWLRARAFGPAEFPTVDGEFVVVEATVGEFTAGRVEGSLQYASEQLTALARVAVDGEIVADLRATVPIAITLDRIPSAELFETRPWRISLDADSVPAEALTSLTPTLSDGEGTVYATLQVTGTPGNPLLAGRLLVHNGAVTVPALDQRYEEIEAHIELEGATARIVTLRARSDGWAVASGSIDFVGAGLPTAAIEVSFDEFRAIGVEDLRDAAVWGDLRVSGPVTAPIIRGRLTVDDGNIRIPGGEDDGLDLGGDSDDLLEDPFLEPFDDGEPVTAQAPWYEAIELDNVIVEAGESLWFVTDELRVQLAGELRILRREPEELRVFGTLEGDQGNFTLRLGPITRRFEIESARVQFFGAPEPDPAIDVTAIRVIPGGEGRRVEIQLNLSGTLSSPVVAFTTADGAAIPESELLSFLIFGQPSFVLADAIGPGESVLAETLFGVGGLAEFAVLEIEELLLTGLGLPLDIIQFRPVPGTLIGVPTLVFGAEIADDLFLTVDAGFGTLLGPTQATTNTWTITLEWRIDREWSLVVGVAPVNRSRLFRGIGTALPVVAPDQQFILELRRQWTY